MLISPPLILALEQKAAFDDDVNLLQTRDVGKRIATHGDQVAIAASGNRANVGVPPDETRR